MSTQKLFFSYSRFDSNFALKLAKDLREAGADIWIDQLDIPAGNHWDSAVEGALSNAACVLVILSPSSTASTNVMDEVSFALESGKKIIPVLLDDCLAPFRLRRLQRIDFTADYAVGFNQLVQALNLTINVAPKPEETTHDPKQSQTSSVDSTIPDGKANDERENNLWEEACRLNTIASYKNYLNHSLKGDNAGEARLLIKQLELQQKENEVEALMWQKAKSENTKTLYQNYLQDYPNGNFEALALAAIADIEKAEKAEQTRLKEIEQKKENERLLKEKQEREQKIKEENEKALREKQAREQKIKEENEKAAREKQERERIKQEEKEKALKEKQEKDRLKEVERKQEQEKALKEKQERDRLKQIEQDKALKEKQEKDRLKQIEKEKAIQYQKEHPEQKVPGAGNKRYILIGAGGLILVLGIWGIMKMSSGGEESKAWNAALLKNDSTAFAGYLQQFPSGTNSKRAKEKLDYFTGVQKTLRDSISAATALQTATADSLAKSKNDIAKNDAAAAKAKSVAPAKTIQKLTLGQSYHGGVIISINATGDHGLVASVKEEGNLNWDKAGKVCEAYKTGNYADWRLPTKTELNMMYLGRKYLGVYIKGTYWSSTEENKNNAWVQNFNTGNQSKSNKSSNNAVRAVQTF